jgi:1-acyl-sn-glycerol-3-phosphate acyltransferase
MPLLDAATHAIPHDELHRWSAAIGPDLVAYPSRILSLSLHGPVPTSGEVRVEARFDGFEGSDRFPRIRLQLSTSAGIWADLTLVEVLFPRGPLGNAPRLPRRAFLTRTAPGLALSRFEGDATVLSPESIRESDWLPGTVASVYGLPAGADLAPLVAAKDHVAHLLGLHPSAIELSPDGSEARTAHRPFERFPIERTRDGDRITVRSRPSAGLDTSLAEHFWARKLNKRHYLVPDLYLGLARRFIGSVAIEDPHALHALRGKPVLFLANHQVGIESPLFSILAASLIEGVITTVAKAEHQTSWLGKLITHSFSYPGVVDPGTIVFFDRSNEAALLDLLGRLRESMKHEGKSLLVHVEGTRATTARTPVQRASSIWVDLALAAGAAIVPVRFWGALPLEGEDRLEFPTGMGQQHIHIGSPIQPAALQQLPLPARQRAILDAINALGPALDQETPSPPDVAFSTQVEEWRRQTGATEVQSVLFRVLEQVSSPSEDTSMLTRSLHEGRLHVTDGERGTWLAAMARFLASPS